jgi:FkbM family methyltransferase
MKTDNECGQAILRDGIFEYPLIEWCQQYLSPNGTFIDVGAHMGTYSIILSSYCKQVYSFEPQGSTFECLNQGINANKITNIITHNVGIGSKEEMLSLSHVSEDGGGSSLLNNISDMTGLKTLSQEVVDVVPLDSYEINNINLIKIDVEGFELEVLKGAVKTLERNNYPPILFEAWPNEWYQEQREELIDYAKGLGYNIHKVGGSDNMYLASDHPKYTPPDKDKSVVSTGKLEVDYKLASEQSSERYGTSDVEDLLEWDASTWLKMCRHFMEKKYYRHAYICGNICIENTTIPVIRIMALSEMGLASYYLGKIDEATEALESVITSYIASWNLRNDCLINLSKVMDRLPIDRLIPVECNLSYGYHHSSTSIIPKNSGYMMCVRSVNYIIRDDGGYDMYDPQNIVRTTNYLVETDSELHHVTEEKLIDVSDNKKYDVNIVGMEDIRLFGKNYLLAVYPQINFERVPQMCLGQYDSDGSVTKIVPLKVTENLQCEKNWLPFIKDDKIYVIYSVGPLRIYTIDPDDGTMNLVKDETNTDVNMNEFRGSAPPIPYKDGYLFTIHQVYHSNPRKYFHRFMWMDKDFNNIKYSKLFYFQDVEIEFNLSICHHEDGLLMPYSFRDSSSSIGVLPYEKLDSILKLN